ncbi:hypothetical protein PPACK8108_LOCUS23558 [Phakopsora pachyrhizi]|uniref:Uncharacterized protein n=1 Tax=Phakopsora pachyrhizi TaxID=170000 RepID=A0AAV0BQG1_PHAPC|nr:hypothetical protein PPACK8108_LOCUS23558 [Phakopsora pachyrhizi]
MNHSFVSQLSALKPATIRFLSLSTLFSIKTQEPFSCLSQQKRLTLTSSSSLCQFYSHTTTHTQFSEVQTRQRKTPEERLMWLASTDDHPDRPSNRLLQPLRVRYIVPSPASHQRYISKSPSQCDDQHLKSKESTRDPCQSTDSSSTEQLKPELPSTISAAWRAGLQGQTPNQFSSLRARAMTPAVTVTPTTDISELSVGEISKSTTVEPSSKPKKSLLQLYLGLDKRSQRFVSISVFLWALSGFVYFTWFAEIPDQEEPKTRPASLTSRRSKSLGGSVGLKEEV